MSLPLSEPDPAIRAARPILKAFIVGVAPRDSVWTRDFLERILANLEESLDYMPDGARRAFLLGLRGFELGPIIMGPVHRPFTRLGAPQRHRYIELWGQARFFLLRDFLKAMKGLVMLAYYEQPEIIELLGWHQQDHIDELKASYGDIRR